MPINSSTYSEVILVAARTHEPVNAISNWRKPRVHHQGQVATPTEVVRELKPAQRPVLLPPVNSLPAKEHTINK